MAGRTRNGKWMNSNRSANDSRSKFDRKPKPQFMNGNDYRLRLQEVLYSSDYILTKIFRKDGPPLGVEFDSLPSSSFSCGEILIYVLAYDFRVR